MTTPEPPPAAQPAPPPAAQAAPPPPTSTPVRGKTSTASVVPLVLGAISAVAVFVTVFLAWLSFDIGSQEFSEKGTDVPVEFLVNSNPGDADPSLLVALVPIALIIVIGAVLGQARVLSIIGGVLAVIVAILFVIQTGSLLDDNNVDLGTFDAIGIAPYICFGGGIVAVVSGLLPRSD